MKLLDIFHRENPTKAEIQELASLVSNYRLGQITDGDPNSFKNKSEVIRILVVGGPGEGKSSFIKTLLQFCGNAIGARIITTSRDKDRTNTVILKRHRVSAKASSQIFISDSPGFEGVESNQLIDIKAFINYVDLMVRGCYNLGAGAPQRNTIFNQVFLGEKFIKKEENEADVVLFITQPPVHTLKEGNKFNFEAHHHLKKMKKELERLCGNKPFFFVISHSDKMEDLPEVELEYILNEFDGCKFVVGKMQDGKMQDGKPMPSVKTYKELMEEILYAVENYRITYAE